MPSRLGATCIATMETRRRTVALGFSLSGRREGPLSLPPLPGPPPASGAARKSFSCASCVSQIEGHSCRARKRAAATRASS
eukprot:7611380-Pyramimonas_sp.AAC.1